MRFTPFVQRTFNAHARQSFVLARYGMVPSSRTSAAWIGRRDELRRHLARRSAGGVIQRRQILSNRPARVRSKLVDAPRFAGRGALFVFVRRNQACVPAKPSPPTSPSRRQRSTK